MERRDGRSYKRISSATTTAVKAATGRLVRVIVNKTTTGTVTINDSLGTISVLAVGATPQSIEFDVACAGKIEVVTSAADDVTVVYE